MKEKLDNLVKKYETKDFIKSDPIQFPHRYKSKEDIEISAFISSLFAFGARVAFIKKLDLLFSHFSSPFELISDYKKLNLDDFIYRFVKSCDLVELLRILNKLYIQDKTSLEELFSNSKASANSGFGSNKFQLKSYNCIKNTTNYFYSNCKIPTSGGFCFLFAKPENNSALKRLNMFLRWMVRKNSPVDFGIWNNISQNELLIPLDTHVSRLSREFGLLKRKQNDFRSVIELTEKLKEFDEFDPVKYDFALFGLGVDELKAKSAKN